MEQLHDIEGIDVISSWPLAMGWWVVIALGIVVLGSILWLLWRRIRYLRSWKRDTFRRLDDLEENLSPHTSGEAVIQLSEYLRRIVVRRFPRKECAGLVGEDWLRWLKEHDPKQYDWTEKGKLLVEIPYAPSHGNLSMEQIKELIQAVRYWVY